MTRRQETFVSEYLIDLSATKAAIRAGYSQHSAAEIGSNLLSQPDIAEAVARAIEQRLTRVGMKQDDVLQEMSLLANSRLDWFVIDDHGQVALAEDAPQGAMACVQSIKRKTRTIPRKNDEPIIEYDVELKLYDKITPLRLMGRHIGLFPDRVEHSGPNGQPIELVGRIERVIIDAVDGEFAPRLLAPNVPQ